MDDIPGRPTHRLSAGTPRSILLSSDERAAATLKVIAELSNKTQVLFFTHHARLVELAESVKTSPVSIYHLDSAPGTQIAQDSLD